jgi:hypothetical protein
LYLLYNKNRLEELEDAKSDSNEKLANNNTYVPNIANNNGPILAIKDKSDSNEINDKSDSDKINQLTKKLEDLKISK